MVDFDIVDNVVRINAMNWVIEPSVEDSEAAMAVVIDVLQQAKSAERVILAESREYEYSYEQVKMLRQIAEAQNKILTEAKLISISNLGPKEGENLFAKRISDLQFLTLDVLRKDPIGAYVQIQRMIAHEQIAAERAPPLTKRIHTEYIANALQPYAKILEETELIQRAKPYLATFKPGDRRLYREFFHPLIKPNFMLTRYMTAIPKNGKRIDRYEMGNGIIVEIFKVPGKVRYFYHVSPPEFRLSEDKYTILDSARRYLAEHKPTETEFTEPEKARELFFNIGKDLVKEISRGMGLELLNEEIQELANILSRYTAGFGVLELLLADDKIEDIFINSPIGINPIFINHSDFEECETNLIPTRDDAEAWATRFRLYSGRPLDEANPVLDTELNVPGGTARVAAITRTLSPEGLGFALRRHRDKPWTFPLYLSKSYFDPLYAGLMSFIIDGGRAVLVAGGRSSGKTSLLGAMLLEIMKRFRIITVEDSVTGDCQIVYYEKDKLKKATMQELMEGQFSKHGYEILNGREILWQTLDDVKVFSFDKKGKLHLSKVSQFIRHKVKKPIYEVETRTGRKIKVTADHSLFTLGKNGKLEAIKTSRLRIGDYIATPRLLKFNNKPIEHINLLSKLEKLPKSYVTGLTEVIKKHSDEIKSVAIQLGYPKAKDHNYPSVFQNWKRKGILPSEIVKELIKNGIDVSPNDLRIKLKANSTSFPILFELDEEFLAFVGLWLADGCYDKRTVIISSPEEENESLVYSVASKFGLNVSRHSDKFSLVVNSKILKEVMQTVLELNGDAYTKKVPTWMYSLSNNQISSLLKGIYSGDGYLAKSEIGISLTSHELIQDIQTLLLSFGIVARMNEMNKKDKTFPLKISSLKFMKKFYEQIAFLQNKRNLSLNFLCQKISTHDSTDVIPLHIDLKSEIASSSPFLNYNDYVLRNNNIGREKFKNFLSSEESVLEFPDVNYLATSDIFWDEIRSIKILGEADEYVYDLSVPENENFVCENIIAHNTLELPILALRQLGYDVERMKSRSVITRVEAELPADEALRTALRLGNSVLIVGEVRSVEAKALYEAMRIGALANLVAGTIHGESAYGVFDRVVNDLGVPLTSFKATDIITIAGILNSPDGLHRFRRVLDVTEVRKEWKTDPIDEGGFVKLMEYSAKEDRLKPTDILIDGESVVLQEIAKKVRDWRGQWDAVWDNILLRAKIKETMTKLAVKANMPELMEAETVVESNEMFHLISEQTREEVGALDSKMIYEIWENWYKDKIRNKNAIIKRI